MATRRDNTAAQLVAGHVKAPSATPDNSIRDVAVDHDAIAIEAYTLWAEQGYRDGHDVENWLEAERRLVRQVATRLDRVDRVAAGATESDVRQRS